MTDTYSALREKYKKIEVPCEICGHEDLALFQNRGRIAEPGVYGDLPITICKKCGFKMQNPRFEDGFYIEYYEAMYREVAFGAERPSDEYVNQQKARGAGVLAYVAENGITPGKMLDHGCASGATMLAWQDAGWEVEGIDPHRPSVLTGREMGLKIEIAAGEELPNQDREFDLLLSLGSFEHSYDLSKTMAEANRVLKDDGALVIRWRSNVIFGSPLEYYNHNHYRFFTPKSWELCLKRYGFEIISTTDKKLEGWDSYSYILAKKVSHTPHATVDDAIAEGMGDDYQQELKDLQDLRDTYYQACKTYIDLCDQYQDKPEELITLIRSDKVDFRWGFLGGEPKDVIARSLMEAKRYLVEYEKGDVR